MAQEEKAKRYDLAIEVAKKYHNGTLKDVMETIFPELAESEDERIRKRLITLLKTNDEQHFAEEIAWLEKKGEKGAKGNEREIPNSEQKPAEWSKEDEQYLLVCKNALAKYQVSDKWDANIISRWLENRLKSLKDRYTWKPSDEQIEALDSATENCAYSEYQDCLRELIGQLKKLREK